MRLVGYGRRKLDSLSDVDGVFKAVASKFGAEDYRMGVVAEHEREQEVAFNCERGAKELKASQGLGFFKKDVVGVIMDNQAHRNRYYVYPHSEVRIETLGNGSCPALGVRDWLSLAEALIAATGLDVAMVMGRTENTADYYRTPLGCGIGLIKVFWINCFGRAYAAVIPQHAGSTSFFKRETCGTGYQAFVSAASYEAYQSASPELRASQRCEIGEDLFHCLPAEEPNQGQHGWILNLKMVFRLLALFCRHHTTDWRRYQAKTVPEYYRRNGAVCAQRG